MVRNASIKTLKLAANMPLGYVLTLSPIAGINYLDKSSLQNIQLRPGTRAALDPTSFIGNFAHRYSKFGSRDWPSKSTVCFVVEMLTQLLMTPDGLLSGTPVPNIQSAYIPSVRDLVR